MSRIQGRRLVGGAILAIALFGGAACSASGAGAQGSSIGAPQSGSPTAATGTNPAAPTTIGSTEAKGSVAGSTINGTANRSKSSGAPSSATIAPPTTDDPSKAPTTPIPAAGGGNIHQKVSVSSVASLAPAPLTGSASPVKGVDIKVASAHAITATAHGPGEVAGPAVQINLSIFNGTSSAINVGDVSINIQDAAAVPGSPMSASPAAPLTGLVDAGAMASGVYVFTLPLGHRTPVTVTVSYTGSAPVAVFTGNVQ